MWKKTGLQLIKEFWLPALGSAGWTAYVTWAAPSVEDIVKNFGTSFFLIAWATSQFFRVRKQAGVEDSFKTVEARINHVVARLEHAVTEIGGHATGGDSYLYYEPISARGRPTLLGLRRVGPYTVYNVVMKWREYRYPGTWGDFESKTLGDVHSQLFLDPLLMDLDGSCAASFDVLFETRNGTYSQNLRFRLVSEKWECASRVVSKGQPLLEVVSDGFPRWPDGTVDWNPYCDTYPEEDAD